jgi:hypothetical protein
MVINVHARIDNVTPTFARHQSDRPLAIFIYIGDMALWGRDAATFRRLAAVFTEAAEAIDAETPIAQVANPF